MKKYSPNPDQKPIRREFTTFPLSTVILSAVEKAGYTSATDIQLEAIPAVIEGKDVLARAETGSGKTAAFVLPLLENLSGLNVYGQKDTYSRYDGKKRANSNCVQVLVLIPTRELAIQVREVFEQIAENIDPPLRCLSVYGGVKINPQMMAIRGGADILVSTPGRLLDLVDQNAIKFNQVKTLVIDEVDRLMKGDFENEINRILKLLPNKRQNLMFTATFPESIRRLVREIMNDPTIINVDETMVEVRINQRAITVNHDKKNDLLAHLLKENDWEQILVFCSAKRTCDNLVAKLEKRDVKACAMHGNQDQPKRAAALRDFKAGKIRILIATDVAARGIDIDQLPCVINYDLPRSPNDYIHRIGRTGRAGETGTAISLIAHHEYQHFGVIEKRNDVRVKREQIAGFEADKEAPPLPERTHPKKKSRSKNRKKRIKREQTPDTNVEQISDSSKDTNKSESIYPEEPVIKKQTSETTESIPEKEQSKKLLEEDQPIVNEHIWGKR
ncbi:MAG: DEAD/DEAH box helicase [Gammaproteobacteria bacterium]